MQATSNTEKQSPLFGIQADEVTDSSNKEQLGVVLPYVADDQPVEKLVECVECENTTGEALAEEFILTENLA